MCTVQRGITQYCILLYNIHIRQKFILLMEKLIYVHLI